MPFSLSMGIPASGNVASLQARLEAALAQEQPFAEVVVALTEGDNATEAIVRGYAARVRVVRAPTPLPPLGLWNLLAETASSDWFSILRPGDCCQPHYARALEEAAALSPEATLVRAGWRRLRPDGSPAETHTLYSVRSVVHPAEALYEQRFGPKASFAAFAVRRDILREIGGFPGVGGQPADWALWLLAGARGDTVRSREVIADAGALPTPEDRRVDKCREIEEIWRIYSEVLPATAATSGLGRPLWIEAASRKRFRDMVIACSHEFPLKERNALAEALRPWAHAVDQLPLLRRLERGDRILTMPFRRSVRPMLKRVISAVRQ